MIAKRPTLPGHEYEGDFPPGSCFSCGGTVQAWWKLPNYAPIERCPNCGPVVFAVEYDRDGKPRQGWMTEKDATGGGNLRFLSDYRAQHRKRG